MFEAQAQSPTVPARLMVWQSRISRIPRWAWMLIGLAVIIPLALLFVAFAVLVVTAGLAILAVVLGVVTVRNIFKRLSGGTRPTQLSRPERQPMAHNPHEPIVVERVDNQTNPEG